MSLLLGLIFSTLAGILAPAEFADLLIRDQAGALQSLAPLTTLLFWLGPVNFILGVFNLVPGFPLDGGRVLRATVWWLTGSLERATRTAAGAGRLFGWLLMALGVMQVLSGAAVQGLWLVLIGWFLSSAASSSYSQMMMRRTLQGCRVEDVMRTHFETVDADIPVARFIDDFLLKSNQRLWPVTAAGRLVGFANLETIQELEAERRHTLRIRDIMRTDLDELSLPPHADAMKAMERLSLSGSPLAVVRGEEVLGLVAQDDMVKWLALHRR
jgi:predicted transcriptional regulator